jgi:hypothetical protein
MEEGPKHSPGELYRRYHKDVIGSAQRQGAEVTFSGVEMKIAKKEPGKDLVIYCDGNMIPRYKAEGYTLDEFKKILADLGILDWATFEPEDKWPFKGERILVVRNKDKNSWFP